MYLLFVCHIALCCTIAVSAHAAPSSNLPDPVVRALQQEGVPLESVSVVVAKVDDPTPILAYRATTPMNPASVMKLVTSYAALELLGVDYRWSTKFYTRGSSVSSGTGVSKGVLLQDLYIQGSGDPALDTNGLREALSTIRQQYGIQRICCTIYLDTSAFLDSSVYRDTSPNQSPPETSTNMKSGKPNFQPNFDDQPFRAYNAPAEAAMVNQQAVRFKLTAVNQQPTVVAYPAWDHQPMQYHLTLTDTPCGDWKNQLQLSRSQQTLHIKGSYSKNCDEKYIDLSWLSGPDYVGQLTASLWQELGGRWGSGSNTPSADITSNLRPNIRQAKVPEGAFLLTEQVSPTLPDVLRMMNKYSNNVMAKAVYLAIGRGAIKPSSTSPSPPASVEASKLAIDAWLATKQLAMPELVLENGSGLSRNERISAAHLAALLQSAYQSPVMPELISSLPVVGLDGTMEHRKNNPLVGRAHLKSGSLDQVRAMAGYVMDQNNQRWVIVWIANGASAAQTKPAQDALLSWVYYQSDSTAQH